MGLVSLLVRLEEMLVKFCYFLLKNTYLSYSFCRILSQRLFFNVLTALCILNVQLLQKFIEARLLE